MNINSSFEKKTQIFIDENKEFKFDQRRELKKQQKNMKFGIVTIKKLIFRLDHENIGEENRQN